MNKGKKIVALVSVLVLVCALIFVAFILFQVRNITVSGCTTLDPEQVVALSGIQYGESIFFVDTAAALKALAANPAIKPLGVKIVYPYSVEIEIQERTPAAYIDTDNIRLALDTEGVLLSVDMSPQGEAVPQVIGFSTARFEVGQPLGEDAYKRSVFSKLLPALQNAGIAVTQIDITYTSAIKLVTKDGYLVELGDESKLDVKLSLARYAMSEFTKSGKTGGILDVATAEKAYYREN